MLPNVINTLSSESLEEYVWETSSGGYPRFHWLTAVHLAQRKHGNLLQMGGLGFIGCLGKKQRIQVRSCHVLPKLCHRNFPSKVFF